MKKSIKKWRICGILITIIMIIGIIVFIMSKKDMKEDSKNVESLSNDFTKESDKIESHINEFSYNYSTGEVEYRPSKITLKMYNKVETEMTEKEVIYILGNGDQKSEGENTYMISWGNADMSKGYWIQIIFDKNNKVISKSQIGLK